jgi:hypothetical protein
VSFYLVRTTGDDDRLEYIAKEIARVVAVNFHEEVAARPIVLVDQYLDDPKSWQRYDKLGNPIIPEEEEGQAEDV